MWPWERRAGEILIEGAPCGRAGVGSNNRLTMIMNNVTIHPIEDMIPNVREKGRTWIDVVSGEFMIKIEDC